MHSGEGMSSLLILYGSETGTAQDTAESLRRESIQRSIRVRLLSLDDYNVDELCNETAVLFVVSTTGQGELPPSMRPAWKRLLRRGLPSNWLSTVNTSVFGLGDSSYQKYNFAAKKLFRRLNQLGARMTVDLGLADDQHELGIDGALTSWKEQLWSSLFELKVFETMSLHFDPTRSIPSKYILNYSEEATNGVYADDFTCVSVKNVTRATADDHFQDTRFIEFHAPQEELNYKPGDVLLVWPYNLQETVDIAFEALGYTDEMLDRTFCIHPRDPYMKPPPSWLIGSKTTLRTCFHRLLDLQMIPKKSFFEILGSISTDEMEKEKLFELASSAGLDDLLDYSFRCRRTVAESLRDFPATAKTIPAERLFDIFTTIRPRAFSIASCREKHGSTIQLIVAKVEYKSRMSEPRRGLCSPFLSRMKSGDKVRIRAGTFKFPPADVPVVCIGPGTGVAPFRSYLSWRESQEGASQSLLFFGCRGPSKDFYFAEEWKQMANTTIFTAFSRDGGHGKYVQDVMKDEKDILWQTVNVLGSVFVAGSSGDMPKGVAAALDAIALEYNQDQFTLLLESKNRLQYETW